MTDESRAVSVGRVGRAHGYDGTFYVDGAERRLEKGDHVVTLFSSSVTSGPAASTTPAPSCPSTVGE